MNAKLVQFKTWLMEKNHLLITVIVLLLLGMATTIYFQRQSITKWKDKYATEEKLKNALIDTVDVYKNSRNELVAEKLTIQETVKNLEKIYGELTKSQKELIDRVKDINKKNEVIAAALIQANFKIDSLIIIAGKNGNAVTVDTTKKIVNFNNLASKDTSFVFDIDVNNILPARLDIKPSMLFKTIEIPNKQFIEFHWIKNKKESYPVSFSVSNSNKYIKVSDLNSYAIPDVKYEGSKFGQWITKNGKMVISIGAGVIVGGGAVYFLTK